MLHSEILQRIQSDKVIALIWTDSPDNLLLCDAALASGGLNAIELTMTTPGALELVAQMSGAMPGVGLGLGTVLDAAAARAGVDAGAQFIVTPAVRPEVIAACQDMEVPVLSGALTPSEVRLASDLGADVIKVFPAEFFSPAYVKSLRTVVPALCPADGRSNR